MSPLPRPRGSLTYGKPPLALSELVDRLADRGLEIPDQSRALRYLRHIGYYRLSPYTIPFQVDPKEHTFRSGVSFDDVLDLYAFDRALRVLVMDALERAEIAIRAALTDHMSTKYADPHWYTDPRFFRDRHRHDDFLTIIRSACESRLRGSPDGVDGRIIHRSALEHYLLNYGSPELPPSWLMVENITIGQLSGLYHNVSARSDRTAIAASLGLNAPILESWIKTYVRVRNICAHHGRLWNVGVGVYPAIPNSPAVSWLSAPQAMPERSRKRLYPILVSLQAILDSVSPGSTWAQRLHHLVDGRPRMNLAGMGIPEAWSADPFWRRHLRD